MTGQESGEVGEWPGPDSDLCHRPDKFINHTCNLSVTAPNLQSRVEGTINAFCTAWGL